MPDSLFAINKLSRGEICVANIIPPANVLPKNVTDRQIDKFFDTVYKCM